MTTTKTSVGGNLNKVGSVSEGFQEQRGFFQNATRYLRRKFKNVRDLNDAEFLSLFDIPEVNHRIGKGFNIKANAALVEHFHQRVEQDWLKPPSRLIDLAFDTDSASDAEVLERANLVLDYDLEWSGIPPEIDDRGGIDWEKNILENRQWLERINRHGWWPLLGHAYQLSGDERYAKAFATQLSAWMNVHFPADSTDNNPHVWSSRQVALRLRVSWIPAFGMFYKSPHFNTTRKLEMLRSIFDQARFLKQSNASDSLVLNGGLVSAGISFPEVPEAGKWRKAAIRSCRDYLNSCNVAETETVDFQRSTSLLAYSDRELASTACS